MEHHRTPQNTIESAEKDRERPRYIQAEMLKISKSWLTRISSSTTRAPGGANKGRNAGKQAETDKKCGAS